VTASDKNQLSNLHYDSAGEVTEDQFGNDYSYDAEGRLLSAGGGTYVYDGAGNRVKKTASSTTTLYWPGAGSLLDESNSTGSTMARQVRFAGLLVWSGNVTTGGRFLFQDHLGSTRITATATGTLEDDADYLPFGSLATNYGTPSGVHYTFTSYESDQNESSTDYAVFRNLETSMGRFNRPDPYDGSYDQTDPQSLNRYSYTANRVMNATDPFGLDPNCTDDDEGCEGVGNGSGDDGGNSLSGDDESDDPNNPGGCPPDDPNCVVVSGGVPYDPMGYTPSDNQNTIASVPNSGPPTHGVSSTPNKPPPPPPPPPKQPSKGNSWSHPLTPPTCSQIGHAAAGDLLVGGVVSVGGKYVNPVSILFTLSGTLEGSYYGLFCQN
jgi:RHS repeat-associated protein